MSFRIQGYTYSIYEHSQKPHSHPYPFHLFLPILKLFPFCVSVCKFAKMRTHTGKHVHALTRAHAHTQSYLVHSFHFFSSNLSCHFLKIYIKRPYHTQNVAFYLYTAIDCLFSFSIPSKPLHTGRGIFFIIQLLIIPLHRVLCFVQSVSRAQAFYGFQYCAVLCEAEFTK